MLLLPSDEPGNQCFVAMLKGLTNYLALLYCYTVILLYFYME